MTTPKRPPFKAWQRMTDEEKLEEVRWNNACGSPGAQREVKFLLERLDALTSPPTHDERQEGMNREKMTAKIAELRRDIEVMSLTSQEFGEVVVSQLLPQVTTVEELDALPIWSGVLDRYGDYWRRGDRYWWRNGNPILPGDLLRLGPLTVVWQP